MVQVTDILQKLTTRIAVSREMAALIKQTFFSLAAEFRQRSTEFLSFCQKIYPEANIHLEALNKLAAMERSLQAALPVTDKPLIPNDPQQQRIFFQVAEISHQRFELERADPTANFLYQLTKFSDKIQLYKDNCAQFLQRSRQDNLTVCLSLLNNVSFGLGKILKSNVKIVITANCVFFVLDERLSKRLQKNTAASQNFTLVVDASKINYVFLEERMLREYGESLYDCLSVVLLAMAVSENNHTETIAKILNLMETNSVIVNPQTMNSNINTLSLLIREKLYACFMELLFELPSFLPGNKFDFWSFHNFYQWLLLKSKATKSLFLKQVLNGLLAKTQRQCLDYLDLLGQMTLVEESLGEENLLVSLVFLCKGNMKKAAQAMRCWVDPDIYEFLVCLRPLLLAFPQDFGKDFDEFCSWVFWTADFGKPVADSLRKLCSQGKESRLRKILSKLQNPSCREQIMRFETQLDELRLYFLEV